MNIDDLEYNYSLFVTPEGKMEYLHMATYMEKPNLADIEYLRYEIETLDDLVHLRDIPLDIHTLDKAGTRIVLEWLRDMSVENDLEMRAVPS